jgi:hypothetical protein
MSVSVEIPTDLFLEVAADHEGDPDEVVTDALRLWSELENPHEMIVSRLVENGDGCPYCDDASVVADDAMAHLQECDGFDGLEVRVGGA